MQMNNSHLAGRLLPALVRTPRPNLQIPLRETTLPLISLHPWGGSGRERGQFFEEDHKRQTKICGVAASGYHLANFWSWQMPLL